MSAERTAWVVGGMGVAGVALAWIVAPAAVAHAWLAAVVCWIGWPLGSLALLLIHALTGGAWGWTLRPALLRGVATLPLAVPFALPLALLVPALYPWAHPAAGIALRNGFYLNLPFFAARAALYLVLWLGLGIAALAAGGRGDGVAGLRRLAPPGLILLALSFTFAAIDLTMSLDPHFRSSVYGMVASAEAVLFALSIGVLGTLLAARGDPTGIADLGRLMLALVVLWAYLDFMQVLIVWQSDLPYEAAWYLPRIAGAWGPVAALVALLHFALPFLLLLHPRLRRGRRALAGIAGMLVAAEILRAWWLVLPAAGRAPGLADGAAMLATLGLGAGVALRRPGARLIARETRGG